MCAPVRHPERIARRRASRRNGSHGSSTFTLNGLLDVLREECGLTGNRRCGEGMGA